MFQKSSTGALRTLPALVASVIASAGAEEYRWQISGGYGETELAPFADVERVTLDATYYLDAVDDARGPYALAAFFNKSSRVSAAVTNDKTTLVSAVATIGLPPPGTPTTATATEETTGFLIGGRYVWSSSGWYAGASYRDANTDQEPSSTTFQRGTTIDGYQLFGGRYFGESTSLDLAAGTTRQTTELSINCFTSLCLSGTGTTDVDTDDWSIGALHVRQGTRLTYSISARASSAKVTPSIAEAQLTLPSGAPPPALAPAPGTLVAGISARPIAPVPFTGSLPITDERDTYSLGGELFPTDRLGFRIGVARSDGDFAEDDSYDLAATWFFKRAVAVEFVLARTELQTGSLRRDIDTAELRLLGRL